MYEQNKAYQIQYECWLNVGKASLKCQRIMNALLSDLGITIAQHELLHRLLKTERITQKQLAESLVVVKSNIANHVKRLEKRGYIKTVSCVDDRRSKYLTLTREGKTLVDRSLVVQERLVSKMLENAKSTDIEATNRVMANVMQSLDELS